MCKIFDIKKLQKIYSTKFKIIKVPRPILFLISLITVIGISVLDCFLNSKYNIFLLYLFPVIFISWTRGMVTSFIFSLITILVWFFAEILTDFDFSFIHILIINSILRMTVFIVIIFIISILNNLFKEMKEESRHDYLTGIPNIRLFYEYAYREIERMKRNKKAFTISYIDLDNFKQVNDKYGHLEGNKLLKIIADTIKSKIRSIDIFARLGGDEFVLLLPETDLKKSKIVFEKIKQELDSVMGIHSWPVTFSIGVVSINKPPSSIEEVITLSDNLMYSVKASGKNNINYKEYM